MANNLLVDWLNNKKNNVQTNVLKKAATNTNNVTIPNLPIKPTTVSQTGLNLQKAQQPVQTRLNNLNTQTLPTQTNTGVGSIAQTSNQSRFIGFQQQPQAKSFSKLINNEYLYVPTAASKAEEYNKEEENRYRTAEQVIKDFAWDVKNSNGNLTKEDISKYYKEWEGNEDAALQLQVDILPLVQQGQFPDMNWVSQTYGELLKGKELKDIEKIKENIDINNKKLQQIQTNIDKTLKTNWQSLSPNGMKYIQNWNTVLKTLDEAKKQGVVGGASNVEIIDYLAKNNPEFNNIFKELNGLELSEMDKAIVGKKDASLLKQVQNKMSQILIDQVTNTERPSDEEIESVMRGKEKLENDFWGQTGKKIATEIGVPVDSLEKLTYRTYKDIQNKILEAGMEYTKDYAKKELKSAFKEGLGVDLTDEQLNSIDNLYNKAVAPSINEQIKINKQNVMDYAESVNKEYESRKARNLDPDVENYVNNMGMTRSLLQGNLAAFGYKSAGDMAQNADMLVTTALGVVAPEVVLPLMAVDSYSRESQESFEELMETQKKMGISQDEAYDNAQKGSVIVGLASATVELALEKLIGGVETTASKAWHDAFTKEFTKKATEMMTERGLADILKQGATTQFKASLEEGLEEVLQQTIHNKAVQQYDPDQKLTEGLLQAFEGGFYNPMNLLAGGGDVFSNIDTNSIKQGVNNTVDNATARARNIVNNVKDVTNRIEPAPGKIGEAFDSMRNKVTSQGGTNNTQQQGQGIQVNTTSENTDNINGNNYNQNIKNSKALNSVQLGLLKSNNRMNPTKITEFQDKFGKDYGQALADMGYTESQETNVPKIEQDTKEIYNEKKKAMNSVEGEFKDRSLRDMLKIMLKKARNTLDYDMIDKYEKLSQKHNTKGLTMAEANDMREEFSYKVKTRWGGDGNSDKIDLANNVYTAVKNFLEKTAEANGIKDLQKMNREIAMRKYLSTRIGDKAERQSANNMVSLTDWVMLAEAASNPYAAAGLATKKIMQQPKVKNAVLNIVVGRRENRAIDQQNRQTANKERMENIESANRGKELQQELTPSNILALPNGIKLTKVTEIDARKPKNKVTKKNNKSDNNKKSDSSSSDDGSTPTGGTPTGTNPTNNQGGTPAADDTKNKVTKKKAETKTKTTSRKSAVTEYINETPQNERGQMEEIEAEENLRNNETPQRDMEEETPKNKVTSKKAEATAPKTKNKTVDISNVKNISDLRSNLENKVVGDHRVDYGYINGKYYEIEEFVGEYHIVEGGKPSDINHAKNGVAIGGQYVNTINGLKAFIEGKSNGEVIKADRTEETTPKKEENQTSEHFSYKDYGEFMKKYEAAEKEINDRLDKQMDKERAEKMERFNELTKKEDKTDAEGNEMMKLAGELNNMSNKYDRLKEQEFNKKHPELVAEKQRQNEIFDRDWKAAMDKKMEEINKPFNNLRDKYLKELRDELGIADDVTLDSDFYNSLTPEQKKIADEINKEYAEKYEELRQKTASVKTIEEESKAKITKNKKNKVTNPSKVKESSLFNENEVDKGNKSEGLNPDALPLSDYKEMERLQIGRYGGLWDALKSEDIKDYMSSQIANEKVGIKPDWDDNEAWDKLPEDFEDDWEAVASDIEEMYDAYEEYLDMKNGGDTFDENTLKNTLESANFYANRQFPGKTAKEVIDQYTPQYEADLKIYNRLFEKYPGLANRKIDLTGAEGKARREFADQENETAQDIDYQELAERENETPQVEDEELNTSPLDLEFGSERRTAEELDENETPGTNEEEMNSIKRHPNNTDYENYRIKDSANYKFEDIKDLDIDDLLSKDGFEKYTFEEDGQKKEGYVGYINGKAVDIIPNKEKNRITINVGDELFRSFDDDSINVQLVDSDEILHFATPYDNEVFKGILARALKTNYKALGEPKSYKYDKDNGIFEIYDKSASDKIIYELNLGDKVLLDDGTIYDTSKHSVSTQREGVKYFDRDAVKDIFEGKTLIGISRGIKYTNSEAQGTVINDMDNIQELEWLLEDKNNILVGEINGTPIKLSALNSNYNPVKIEDVSINVDPTNKIKTYKLQVGNNADNTYFYDTFSGLKSALKKLNSGENVNKTTTEVTGEKNAVTAKPVENEKPKNLVTSKKGDNFMGEQAKSFDTPEAFIESAVSKDYKVGDNVKGLGTIQDVTDTQVKINGQRFAKKILGDNIDNVTLSIIRSTLDDLQAKNKDISDIISARKKGLYLLSFIQNSKNKQHLADIGYLEPVGDSSGAEGFTTAKSHMRDYANLKHGVENAEKQLREYWESVNKGNSEDSSTSEQQSEFETLPDDVTVSQEAKQLGAKRIAPDRVPRQQLTFDEGVNKIAENLETLAEYKKARDEIYSPEGYNDGEVYIRYNNLKKEFQNIMYGNNGFQFKSNKSKEFTDLWKNIVDNKDNKTALREVAKNFYISKVKKDISKGYVYPQEVLDKIPGAKKAIDNRERYEKGLNTSFSAKDERIDYSEKDKIGAGMKSQDGKQITKEQKEDIVKGILDFGKTLGLDMKKFAEDRGLVYVHLHGGLAFLNNMAAGLYRESTNEQGEKNISVSVGGAENVRYKDPKTKERKTTTLNTTMSHELGHAMDYLLDNKLFSWTQKSILGSKYNPVNRLRKYYAKGNEIVARAIEQYVAVENGQPNYYLENGNLDAGEFKGTDLEYALKEVGSYYERPGYWSKPDYEKYVKPYVEEAFKNNFEEYKINKSQKKNVLSNDKNKITSK